MDGIYFPPTGPSCPVAVEASYEFLRLRGEALDERIGYGDLTVALGGDQGRYLVCRAVDGREFYIEQTGLLGALAAVAPPDFVRRVRDLVIEQGRRRRRIWAAALAAMLVLVAGLVWAVLAAHELAVNAIPPAWEETLGRTLGAGLGATGGGNVDPRLTRFVQDLGARLLSSRPDQPYRFHYRVLRSEEVNAFALPGGEVMVYTGLIARSRSAEEVAGVLGHEIAHVLERHSLRSAVGQLSVAAAWTVFLDPGEGLAGLAAVASAAQLKFSRDHERQADALGLELLAAADIDPAGMSTFFERLADDEGRLGSAIAILSTHPASAERAQELSAKRQALGQRAYRPIEVDWGNLQALAEGK